MRIDHMVDELKQEVVIPEVVQRKARDAFGQIGRASCRERV